MAELRNARHELFATFVAAGMTATAAYKQAGYTPDRSAANRLRRSASVNKRIQDLQRAQREALEARALDDGAVTVQTIRRELDENRAAAKSWAQSGGMNMATRIKGQLYGLLKEGDAGGSGPAQITVNNVTLNRIVRVVVDPADPKGTAHNTLELQANPLDSEPKP